MRTFRDAVVSVLLLVVYVVVFVPAGLIARLSHDPLRRRPSPTAVSYWSNPTPNGRPAGPSNRLGRESLPSRSH
ncbi:MAG TPA: hypothetical protein VHX38_34475 [Pseudonocardiaceae bacterium]|nr:hypothetical protein [Pseudonocardiaceae bacterium]